MRLRLLLLFFSWIVGLLSIQESCAQFILEADGESDTYELIRKGFGESTAVEVPDCNHTSFGPHMRQIYDFTLRRYVFALYSHIRLDYDAWCSRFDRQRTEINGGRGGRDPDFVSVPGERMTLSWNFKLDHLFTPPYGFCHIHQVKASGGDDSMPIITITTRKSNPNELQLLLHDSKADFFFLKTTPLEPFLGEWIHVKSDFTAGHNGTFEIQLSRLVDGYPLFNYTNNNIDFWRNGSMFTFPKWGIYRTVQEAVLSRDESVLFDRFCVGKGHEHICQ